MVKLKGAVTKVEQMDVEVCSSQIASACNDLFSPFELLHLSYKKWLGLRGLGTDVKLNQNSQGEYYFKEYENNGSHYSGYFDRLNAYREGDEIIFDQYHKLFTLLAKES